MTKEDLKEKYDLAYDNIKFPVKGDEYGHVYDVDNNLILDIRGWGRLQYKDRGEEIMFQMENLIVDLLNSIK